MKELAATFALVACVSPACAQSDITITTPERPYAARTIEIKERAGQPVVEFQDATGRTQTIQCSDVVDIAVGPLAPTRSPGPAEVQVSLWTQDTFTGTLQEADPDGVRLKSSALGETVLKFDHIESVRFLANEKFWPSQRPQKLDADVVITRTADVREGTLLKVDKSGVAYKSKVLRGRTVEVKCADCAVVYTFAPMGDVPQPPTSLYAIVQLTDTSAIRGVLKEWSAGVLKFVDLFGTERSVSSSGIAGIYFKNGRVVYLSDLPIPAENVKEEHQYIRDVDPSKRGIAETPFPFQRDRNAKEGAKERKLAIRGQEFRKGLGVHARSELSFDLEGQFATFEAILGIDDCVYETAGEPCGSVVFRVIGDGKVLRESGNVTWKDRPLPISVPIAGVKRLTLLVDWGEDYHRGDYADWANARVIR